MKAAQKAEWSLYHGSFRIVRGNFPLSGDDQKVSSRLVHVPPVGMTKRRAPGWFTVTRNSFTPACEITYSSPSTLDHGIVPNLGITILLVLSTKFGW